MSRWRRAKVVAIEADGSTLVRIAPPGQDQGKVGNQNSVVMVEVRSPRSLAHHKKYWALLHAVVEATGRWPNAETCHRWIKWELGMYTPIATKNDAVVVEWDSTDFGTMTQTRFRKFYDQALGRLAKEIGVDPETLGTQL